MRAEISLRTWTSGVVVIALACAASPASGQARVTFIPSASVSSVYDDNLFARTNGTGDQMTLLSPGIEALFDTPVVNVLGIYSFDMQRSVDHPTLNDVEARRRAITSVIYRKSARLALTGDVTYDRTDNAGDLNATTALLINRLRAHRWQVGPSMHYQTSPRSTITARYDWTNEGIDGFSDANEHVARVGYTKQVTARASASIGYLGRHFVNGSDVRTSNTALVGYTYDVSPFSKLMVQAGPRLASRGGVAPEVVGEFVRKGANLVTFGADYWRGESITLGVVGPVEVNSATARVVWPVYRQIELGVQGGFFNSTTISQGRARVFHNELVAAWTPKAPIIIAASYGTDFQRGDVRTSLLADQHVVRHVFVLRLTVAPHISRSFHPDDPLQPLGGPSTGVNP